MGDPNTSSFQCTCALVVRSSSLSAIHKLCAFSCKGCAWQGALYQELMDNNEIRIIWHAAKAFSSGLQTCAACSPRELVLHTVSEATLCFAWKERKCTQWAFSASVKPDTVELVGMANMKPLFWVIDSIALTIVCAIGIYSFAPSCCPWRAGWNRSVFWQGEAVQRRCKDGGGCWLCRGLVHITVKAPFVFVQKRL